MNTVNLLAVIPLACGAISAMFSVTFIINHSREGFVRNLMTESMKDNFDVLHNHKAAKQKAT